MAGRTLFGLHTLHFTQECEDISYIVTVDGRKVPYSSPEVAQRSADFWRKEGHDVSDEIEEKRTVLRCGEVYY